jgi:hypothetical protein
MRKFDEKLRILQRKFPGQADYAAIRAYMLRSLHKLRRLVADNIKDYASHGARSGLPLPRLALARLQTKPKEKCFMPAYADIQERLTKMENEFDNPFLLTRPHTMAGYTTPKKVLQLHAIPAGPQPHNPPRKPQGRGHRQQGGKRGVQGGLPYYAIPPTQLHGRQRQGGPGQGGQRQPRAPQHGQRQRQQPPRAANPPRQPRQPQRGPAGNPPTGNPANAQGNIPRPGGGGLADKELKDFKAWFYVKHGKKCFNDIKTAGRPCTWTSCKRQHCRDFNLPQPVSHANLLKDFRRAVANGASDANGWAG